jgi:leucine-rich PPR motif-containing protein
LNKYSTVGLAFKALLLLRCCGTVCVDAQPEERTKIVERVWKLLEETGVTLDVSHYNALLRAHVENDHQFSPTQFLDWYGTGVNAINL